MLKHTIMSKSPATAGSMLNKKCLILRGALFSTALIKKFIALSGQALGAQMRAGSLRLAGQQEARQCRRRRGRHYIHYYSLPFTEQTTQTGPSAPYMPPPGVPGRASPSPRAWGGLCPVLGWPRLGPLHCAPMAIRCNCRFFP